MMVWHHTTLFGFLSYFDDICVLNFKCYQEIIIVKNLKINALIGVK